jgi:hypothetical protein
MSDLVVYIPFHGYDNEDAIYVSWLDDVYFVKDKNDYIFKLTDAAGTTYLQWTEDISEGYVREVDGTSGVTTIGELDHLEGLDVFVTSGGEVVGSYTVTGGEVTVPSLLFTYQAGLAYTSSVRTTRLEIPGSPTIQSRVKKINEAVLRYVSTKNGSVGQEIRQNKKSVSITKFMSALKAIFSKKSLDVAIPVKGGSAEEGYVTIESAEPYPMTAIAAVISFDIKEQR